jgi:hypothetical protein
VLFLIFRILLAPSGKTLAECHHRDVYDGGDQIVTPTEWSIAAITLPFTGR